MRAKLAREKATTPPFKAEIYEGVFNTALETEAEETEAETETEAEEKNDSDGQITG
jgi:hypothetical protein